MKNEVFFLHVYIYIKSVVGGVKAKKVLSGF